MWLRQVPADGDRYVKFDRLGRSSVASPSGDAQYLGAFDGQQPSLRRGPRARDATEVASDSLPNHGIVDELKT